ncbi:phospholipase D family protein [Tenacibaculum geojense]|uniref:Phospholipase D family protein n=1 Tax=Tenacibaculum geojense TaxID=915352 RepID=A0ABW3JMX0_9FLAO
MAEFLTTNGTSYHIEKIITGAKKKLILVSPYLQISKTFYERLLDASKRNVSIKIIYGKDELKPNEKNSLAELKNLELLYFENLHAKCYFNEQEMVITSMNMYEFSEKNNREMGVYVTRNNDKNLFENAVNETLSIIQSSEIIQLSKTKRKLFQPKNKTSNGTNKKAKPKRGYCIRCKERIEYDVEKPYCWDCFATWSQFENTEYEENVCHSCGEFESTSMIKPECYDCYKENK